MGLWSIFFAVGLVPEFAYHASRALAGVSTGTALVNSSAVITLGFSVYIALFVQRQCRLTGMDYANAQGSAIQAALWGMIAFLEIPTQSAIFGTQTLLGIMWNSSVLPTTELKVIIWAVGGCKLLAWGYLYSLMLQFHILGHRDAFNGMRMFLLSSLEEESSTDDVEEPTTIQSDDPDETTAPK